MATAIIIVTDEGGKEAATTIAASKASGKKVIGIAKRLMGTRFIGVETMAAIPLLSKAFEAIKQEWENNPGFS